MATVTEVDLVIDMRSKTPSYIQLADKIGDAIDAGELAPGDAIPSLRQLIEQTGLAAATVQKAIRRLEHEYYVYTVSGRGTYVMAPPL